MGRSGNKWTHLNASMISGARYHLVATYSVKWVAVSFGLDSKPLLSPKSQIFSSQSALTSKLPGFRSRWMTEAECTYFMPSSQVSDTSSLLRESIYLEGFDMWNTERVHWLNFVQTGWSGVNPLQGWSTRLIGCWTDVSYLPSAISWYSWSEKLVGLF